MIPKKSDKSNIEEFTEDQLEWDSKIASRRSRIRAMVSKASENLSKKEFASYIKGIATVIDPASVPELLVRKLGSKSKLEG